MAGNHQDVHILRRLNQQANYGSIQMFRAEALRIRFAGYFRSALCFVHIPSD